MRARQEQAEVTGDLGYRNGLNLYMPQHGEIKLSILYFLLKLEFVRDDLSTGRGSSAGFAQSVLSIRHVDAISPVNTAIGMPTTRPRSCQKRNDNTSTLADFSSLIPT